MVYHNIILLCLLYKAASQISMTIQENVFSIAVTINFSEGNATNCTFTIENAQGYHAVCDQCTSCVYYVFKNLIPNTIYNISYVLTNSMKYNESVSARTKNYSIKIQHANEILFAEHVYISPSAFGAGKCTLKCVSREENLLNCPGNNCKSNCDDMDYEFNLTESTLVKCVVTTDRFNSTHEFIFQTERKYPELFAIDSLDGKSLNLYLNITDKLPYKTIVTVLNKATLEEVRQETYNSSQTVVTIRNLSQHDTYSVNVTFKLTYRDCNLSGNLKFCEINYYYESITLYSEEDLTPYPFDLTLASDKISVIVPHSFVVAQRYTNISCYVYIYAKTKNSDNFIGDIPSAEYLKTLKLGSWFKIYEMNEKECQVQESSVYNINDMSYLPGSKVTYISINVGAVFVICNAIICRSSGDYTSVYVQGLKYTSTATIFTILLILYLLLIVFYLIFFLSKEPADIKSNDQVTRMVTINRT